MAMATDGPDTLSALIEAQRKIKEANAMLNHLEPTKMHAVVLVDLQMLLNSIERAVNIHRSMADAYYFSD